MLMHNAPRVTVMVMIFQVHAYNEWDIGEKRDRKMQTSAHLNSRLNLRHRNDRRYFQLNTRNDPRGGLVASIQIVHWRTLEERVLRAL